MDDRIDLSNSPELTQAIYSIFCELAKLGLFHNMQYPEAEILLKHAYIDTVRNHYKLPDEKRVPDSRVLTKTGIGRRDLTSCNERQAQLSLGEKQWTQHNRLAAIVNAWHHEAGYVDEEGLPVVISKRGPRPSLQDLAARHSGGLSPRAVLDELLANNIVQELPDKKIKVLKKEFVHAAQNKDPAKTKQEIQMIGDMVSNLARTMVYNFAQNSDDNKRYQMEIPAAVVPESIARDFEVGIANDIHAVLEKWNDWRNQQTDDYLAKKAKSSQGLQGSGKSPQSTVNVRNVGFGAYAIEKTND